MNGELRPLPAPADFVSGDAPRIESTLTQEARQWLDSVLDICAEARSSGRRAPGVRKIAQQLTSALGVTITRYDIEGYLARRREQQPPES